MDTGTYGADNGARVMPAEAPRVEDDGAIQDLARRNLAARRQLFGQIFDTALTVFTVFAMIWLWDQVDRAILGFFVIAFWVARLSWRVGRFILPLFKGGITAYFREKRERKFELECARLKKMTPEWISAELSK